MWKSVKRKLIAFVQLSNKQLEFKIKNTMPLTSVPTPAPRNEIPRYKSKKYVRHIYEENYESLIDEIEELNNEEIVRVCR